MTAVRANAQRVTAFLVASLAITLTQRADADETEAARAEALFREGRAAERAGDADTACARFAESERLLHTPAASLNLAVCDGRAGRLLRARDRYTKLLSELPPEDPRVEVAKTNLAAAELRLGRLELKRAAGTPADVTLELDGKPLEASAFESETLVDPGAHVVVARAEGRRDFRSEVVLTEGERRAILVELPPPKEPPPQRVRPKPRPAPVATLRQTDSRTAGWVALGVGGGSLLVGALAALVVLDRKATMNDHCNDDVACDDEGLEAASSGRTWSVVSTIGFGLGAASTGAGIYLLTRPDSKSSGQLRIGPNGVSLVGRL